MTTEAYRKIKSVIFPAMIVSATIIFVSSPSLAGDGAGTEGAIYLRLPVGPKSIALGETGTALEGDPFGWLINPGLLERSPDIGIGIAHSQWMMETSYENAVLNKKLAPKMTLGVGLSYMSTPEIQGYDNNGVGTGSIGNNNFQAIVGFSYAPLKNLGAGVNVKYFQEKIADWTANGFGVDIGAAYKPFFLPDISVGVSVRNLGPKVKFISVEEDLPTTVRAGAAVNRSIIPQIISFAVTADVIIPRHVDAYPAVGGEIRFRDMFSLRAGFCGEEHRVDNGFTAGAGVKILDTTVLDYAWTPYGDLGNFHRISLYFGR